MSLYPDCECGHIEEVHSPDGGSCGDCDECTRYMPRTDRCKHCGRLIDKHGNTWRHVDGPQRGKNTCAIDPYGYEGAPESQPCSHICIATRLGGTHEL